MATVTISATGTGGAQAGAAVTTAAGAGVGSTLVTNASSTAITFDIATAGAVVQSFIELQALSHVVIEGLNNGATTIVNLTTAHGTGSQVGEIIYHNLIA